MRTLTILGLLAGSSILLAGCMGNTTQPAGVATPAAGASAACPNHFWLETSSQVTRVTGPDGTVYTPSQTRTVAGKRLFRLNKGGEPPRFTLSRADNSTITSIVLPPAFFSFRCLGETPFQVSF